MEPWFLREPARLRREREALDLLAQRSPWLVGHKWCFEGDTLCVNATIEAHRHQYEVRVLFPPLFPDVPAIVRPLNATSRLSSHQYGGVDGPLCLEWGPDNWHSEVSGADLIESAHRLFDLENPLGQREGQPVISAPSRHHLTVGQELRGALARWYCSEGFKSFLATHRTVPAGSFRFSLRSVSEGEWILLVHEAAPLSERAWVDRSIPTALPGVSSSNLYAGVWFRTAGSGSCSRDPETLSSLRALLPRGAEPALLATDGTSPVEGMDSGIVSIIICEGNDALTAFLALSGESLLHCARVESNIAAANVRTPDAGHLAQDKIGIVGLGSVGSKAALALARMGARSFYLVDYDVLLPENLDRNALDWQGVARHKVDATATAISLIAPAAEIEVSRIHLTGQESSAVLSGVLDRLTRCAVILDATAISGVFNLLAAAARQGRHALVWVEVFGGGVGGLLARSRSGVDPSPQLMRRAYLQFCKEHPPPAALAITRGYELDASEHQVLVASDADVGILANHAARLVSDSSLPPAESRYPHSMYLIGLAREWIFREPLDTIPIDPGRFVAADNSESTEMDLGQDDLQFLLGLLKAKVPS
jgi:ThiF family